MISSVSALPNLLSTQTCQISKVAYTPPPTPTTNGFRIFLIQTALGLFNTSGGYKANYYLLSSLADQGHSCRSIVLCSKKDIISARIPYTEEKSCFGDEKNEVSVYRFVWGKVEIIGLELENYLRIFPRSTLSQPLKEVEDRMERWLEVGH